MESSVNPWKLATIGIALVVCTAAVTVAVTNWAGRNAAPIGDAPSASPSTQPDARLLAATTPVPAAPQAPPQAQPAPLAEPQRSPATPSQVTVDECNRYAAGRSSTTTKTVEIVKDGAIGGALGAAVGAAGGAIAAGGQGAGKGAAIGGLVGVGGGALYGVNENRKHDERYRQAYAACMRSRGYAG